MKSVRWPNQEYHRTAVAEDEFPAFDETLTSGMEDTVRNLRILPNHARSSVEEQHWQMKAFDTLTKQVKELQDVATKMQEVIHRKASLTAQARFEKDLSARIEKRIDTIRNIVFGALALLVPVLLAMKLIH